MGPIRIEKSAKKYN